MADTYTTNEDPWALPETENTSEQYVVQTDPFTVVSLNDDNLIGFSQIRNGPGTAEEKSKIMSHLYYSQFSPEEKSQMFDLIQELDRKGFDELAATFKDTMGQTSTIQHSEIAHQTREKLMQDYQDLLNTYDSPSEMTNGDSYLAQREWGTQENNTTLFPAINEDTKQCFTDGYPLLPLENELQIHEQAKQMIQEQAYPAGLIADRSALETQLDILENQSAKNGFNPETISIGQHGMDTLTLEWNSEIVNGMEYMSPKYSLNGQTAQSRDALLHGIQQNMLTEQLINWQSQTDIHSLADGPYPDCVKVADTTQGFEIWMGSDNYMVLTDSRGISLNDNDSGRGLNQMDTLEPLPAGLIPQQIEAASIAQTEMECGGTIDSLSIKRVARNNYEHALAEISQQLPQSTMISDLTKAVTDRNTALSQEKPTPLLVTEKATAR